MNHTVIGHFDGSRREEVKEADDPETHAAIRDVWGADPEHVYAVGYAAILRRRL